MTVQVVVVDGKIISFPKLMRANCRIPILVRLIFGTGLLKVVKIHFRFSFQSVQLSTIFIWNTDDSVQDLGAYLMNWVALYFNLSNWGPFSRKNNYEIAKSFCKMKVYLLFLILWRAKLLIIQITVHSRFSDILFSDKPRFSDNFAEDRFFTT